MATLDIDQDRAFQVTRRVWQYDKTKLRVVAEQVVEHRGRVQELPMLRRGQGAPPLRRA